MIHYAQPLGRLGNNLFILSEVLTNYSEGDTIFYPQNDLAVSLVNVPITINNNVNINDYKKNDIKKYNNYYQFYKKEREEVLHKYIKFPESIINQLYEKYKGKTLIHVRRGDYLHISNRKLYYTLTPSYIKYVCDKYNFNNNIVVISDDIKWCIRNLTFLPQDTIYDKGTEIEDLYKITIAKNIICSGSSFSIIGCMINQTPDKLCIGIYPYDKFNCNHEVIYPDYFKLENIEEHI